MNSFQLYQPFAQTNAFQFSFVPHAISLWNSLHPEQVAGSCCEINVFVLVLLLLSLVVVSLYGSHSLVGMHSISFILLLYTQCYYVQTFIEKNLLGDSEDNSLCD